MFTWLRRLLCLPSPQRATDRVSDQQCPPIPLEQSASAQAPAAASELEVHQNSLITPSQHSAPTTHVDTTALDPGSGSGGDNITPPAEDGAAHPSTSTPDVQDDFEGQRLGNILKGTGKALLNLADGVSDALPPLKSVVGGLKVIIELAEKVGETDVDLSNLSARITEIQKMGGKSKGDTPNENQVELERKLQSISEVLAPLRRQGRIERALTASDVAAKIHEYITKVEQALMDYQVSLSRDLHDMGRKQVPLVEAVHAMNTEQLTYDELQLLDKLARVKDAGFNGSDERSLCLEGTRVDILQDIRVWAGDPKAKQIYWLNGHAGSGKSTIAQSIAQLLTDDGRLGASFFCSRESKERGDYKLIFPTLAFQLACGRSTQSIRYKEQILRLLKKNPDIASQALKDQLVELFVKPVKESKLEAVIVVDALDECRDDNSVSIVLTFLAGIISSVPSIRFLITSRPEPHIRAGFGLQSLKSVSDIRALHEVGSASVNQDIELYLKTKLRELSTRRSDIMDSTTDWPAEADIAELVFRASGLFVYASTIVRFVDRKGRNPRKQLALVLQSESTRNSLSALDTLYLGILRGAFPYSDDDYFHELSLVLSFLVVSCDALSCSAIAELLDVDAFDVRTLLNLLQSVIHVPEDAAHPVRFYHKSFPDFLTSRTRCTEERFLVDLDDAHCRVTLRCLRILKQNLKKNICGLPRYSTNDSLTAARRDACITEATRYCCRFWADHLLTDPKRDVHIRTRGSELYLSLHHFATTQQLWWFEALALLQDLRRSVESLTRVYEWLTICTRNDQSDTLLQWFYEGQRFILYSLDAVKVSVAHIYHSALLFSPRSTLLRKHHSDDILDEARLISGIDDTWSAEARTIKGALGYHLLEYSHDGTMLAACNTGVWGYCQLFRSRTGERLAHFTRPSHSDTDVSSISFSHDDRVLAMASGRCVLLWDVTTGAMITELWPQDAVSLVCTVTFHPDKVDLLASVDVRGCVKLWNTKTYECVSEFQYNVEDLPDPIRGKMSWLRSPAKSIALFPSTRGRIELWNIETGVRIRVLAPDDGLPGMSKPPKEIVSSCDGSIIGAHSEEFVGFWDTASGKLVNGFAYPYPEVHIPLVTSMQFSPSNRTQYVVACLTSVFLFDVFEQEARKVGQSNYGRHLLHATFSPDGRSIASSFDDARITFWDLDGGDTDQDYSSDQHEASINSAHVSLDGSYIVTASADQTVKVWSAADGTLCTMFRGFSDNVTNAIFLSDDRYIVISDDTSAITLCNWREGIVTAEIPLGYPVGAIATCDVLLPFTYNGTVGFFAARRFVYERQLITCWLLSPEQAEEQGGHRGGEDNGELERGDQGAQQESDEDHYYPVHCAAQGMAVAGTLGSVALFGEDYVTRITYEARDPASPQTLVLTAECKSGRAFMAPWNFCPPSPDVFQPTAALEWVKVAETDGSVVIENRGEWEPEGLTHILWQRLVYTTFLEGERPVLKTKNQDWILNDREEKILWVPAKHRGRFGRWYGDKLLLEGTSGRLTLLDFAQAKLSSRDIF